MKRFSVLIALLLSVFSLQAQIYYFSHGTQTYTELTNATSVNNGQVWSGFQTFSIPIGFTFDYMSTSFQTVDLEATGRLIFDANHFYYADMFVAQGLRDAGSTSSQSPISYKVVGIPGDRVLKIEIKDATYSGDMTANVNFQIWLYEGDGALELHMGPTTIPNPGGAFSNGNPFSGLHRVTQFSPLTYHYGLLLHGDPASPGDSTISGSSMNVFGITLSGAPVDGQKYRFGTTIPASISEPGERVFSIYPNPAGPFAKLAIDAEFAEAVELQLLDLSGRRIAAFEVNTTTTQLDLSAIPKGMYVIGSKVTGWLKLVRE